MNSECQPLTAPAPTRPSLARIGWVIVLGTGLAAAARGGEAPLPGRVEFNRDIRPILSDACFHCHGPDGAKRKAGLRLDLEAGAKTDLEGHFPVVPGDAGRSELIRRIETGDAEERMPPPDSGRQLSPRQIALLRRWIEQGAVWQGHWSFIAPARPALPPVIDESWPQNAIDRFILARLEAEGLRPSPEADRAALIRRVTLDLTGLPPTPGEVDAFLADPSPGAYETLVDRLLDSPAFGERLAIRWLEAARYADTSGYQNDGERQMWRWRDWVIEACNANMPYDRFTLEQLAGDLLTGATLSQRIATGFNRNHRGNAEGGIIPEEYAAEYVVDRVDTTATVWLGLTLGCARCHDHKYDPVSQREFYQLFAYFNNVPEKGRAIKIGNSPPYLPAPTGEQLRELEEADRAIAAAAARLKALEPELTASQAQWEKTIAPGPARPWTVTAGLLASYPLDGSAANAVAPGAPAVFADGAASFERGPGGQAASLDGRRHLDCGDIGDFDFFDKFTLAAWVRPRGADGAILSRMADLEEGAAEGTATEPDGYSVQVRDGRVRVHLTKRWLDDALRVETESRLATDRWQHVAVVYDGSRLASGVRIYVDGQLQRQRVLLDELNQTFQTKQPLRIGAGGARENRFRGLIAEVRVYGRALGDTEAAILATAEPVDALAAIAPGRRTAAQAAKLRACFLDGPAPAPLREAATRLTTLQARRERLVETIPTVMVMAERPVPRETHVLIRGEYDKRGERVEPGVPASLPPLPGDAPPNRLGLARWLLSPENPLAARVAVNRHWQMVFGDGLVRTAEDFGSQGAPPTHPELLDWLAVEFRDTGWNVKDLLRSFVTSAAYRQDSRATPALLARDPDNRLLARASRIRLPAETIRDQALAAGGLLVRAIGGPSVKPYQPAGLWKDLSGADYEPDEGEKLWRRGLYTFWKRTSAPPAMTTFDAPGREACSVRPGRTSTPLQALALMNDASFVEAARHLARRARDEGGATADEHLRHAFRLVLARAPAPEERAILQRDWERHLARFRADPAAARAFAGPDAAGPADLAAYSAVAGLILNLDEAITRP